MATLSKLAKKIKEDIVSPVDLYKTSIFLCGSGERNGKTGREIIAKELEGGHLFYVYRYNIIYPEDIFAQLLHGSQSVDLLSLENMLAESVDVIIIIPESPGAIAELGAFTNNEKLLNKIICLQDTKYKKGKSFISSGPIKLLKSLKNKQVLYVEFNKIDKHISKIREGINRAKKSNIRRLDYINLLQVENFVLPAIYLLETADKDILIKLVKEVLNPNDKNFASHATTASLTILSKNKQVFLTSKGYKLTGFGLNHFINLGKKNRRSYSIDLNKLDDLRIDILTWRLRNKKLNLA